ncbi:MAG: DUF4870 domain-containing protein [Solirubrobacteraceae bacterium]|nr:DUF4870 domain-containing protein [Solirubrobacteraceae bacterium]
MPPSVTPPPPPAAEPGWYPDPAGSGSLRYWDGARWTDAVSSAVPPAGPTIGRDDTRSWALAAHLSALASLFIGFPFVGPLVVYLVRRDDPFVRRHAAEALNFNLSIMLYVIVLGIVTFILIFVLVGLLLIPLFAVIAVAWIVLICLAAVKAGDGQEYRYPLTIRFVT